MIHREVVRSEVKYARKRLLDYSEALIGEEKKWPMLRKEIMKIFGTSGLGKLGKEGNNLNRNGDGENEYSGRY